MAADPDRPGKKKREIQERSRFLVSRLGPAEGK